MTSNRILLACILATGCRAAEGPEPSPLLPDGELIDLTHPFGKSTLYWPTARQFDLKVESRGMTAAGYYYEANSFCTAEHGGTHLDAPVHFAENRWSADQIPLNRLIGQGVLIDVSERVDLDPDYLISVSDIQGWESIHGRLPADAIVLFRTGFGARWPDPVGYLGTARRGDEGVAELHFPGLAPEAAAWLVSDRKIAAAGIDTASIDFGQSRLFESHQTLFQANIPVFENVAGLDRLPAEGFLVIALPMKIEGGSGGPLRIVAVVPR